MRMEIYKFYQDSFSKEELAEIRALRGFYGLKLTLKNLGVVLLCFFTDCTMANHRQTTIWANMFALFQIEEKTHHKKGMGKV